MYITIIRFYHIDCIFFKGSRHAGANHIGIVTSVNGDTVNTVEGNTSSKEYNDNGGCVAEHSYKFGDSKILGYGHPKFDGSSTFGGVNPDGSESSTTTSGDTSSNGVSSFTDAFSGVASAFTNSLMSQLGINVESNNTDTTTSSDSSSTSTSLAGSSSDAVKRVFNDTWVYEMGKKGPGCYHQPLNDGAGWNYGIASFTQKWNMNDLLKYLESNYPDLRKKLKGSVGTSQFNESWAALGKSDEDRFFDAQLKYLFKSKMDPALSKIKSKTGVDLNNGKYSEGVFSMLLSMANQRPKWVDEKWVPYISGHKNASSEDIINNTGGDIAKNYSGNYANGIRSRYQKQVANSLKLNTPFVYNINDVGGKGGKDKPIPMPSNHRNNKVIPMPRRGKGNSLVSSTSSSLSPEIYNITNSKEINNSLSAKETSQLLNTVIACLSKIVDNTGATSEGISDLMNTNFGNTNNIISTTNNNNVISPKDNNKSTSSKPNTDVDRSQYSMAKRVAAGILT